MSSIRFMKERLHSSIAIAGLKHSCEQAMASLAERLNQRLVKLDSLIQSMQGRMQVAELARRLKIARRYMESAEWGACQFELDCLENELN